MSHNSLRMTLETLIMQPGIRPELVFVFVDEKMDELIHLIDLFDFKFERVESSTSYTDIFHKALTKLLNTNLIDKVDTSALLSLFALFFHLYLNNFDHNATEQERDYCDRGRAHPLAGFSLLFHANIRHVRGRSDAGRRLHLESELVLASGRKRECDLPYQRLPGLRLHAQTRLLRQAHAIIAQRVLLSTRMVQLASRG